MKRIIVTCQEMFTDKLLTYLSFECILNIFGCSMNEKDLIATLKNADVLIMGGDETITRKVWDNISHKIIFIFAGIEARTAFPGIWDEVKDNVFTTGGGQKAVIDKTLQQLTVLNPDRIRDMMAKSGKSPPDRDAILSKQTLLVIGAGGIGRGVMESSKGKFKEVVYAGGRGEKTELRELGFRYIPDLVEAISIADATSIHLELNPDTENSIKVEHLARMPKNAFLLNNARIGVTSPKDLKAFLDARPDVQVVSDTYYLEGALLLDEMEKQEQSLCRQIIECKNFVFTGHNANRSELTKEEYTNGALRILEELKKLNKF